MAYIVPADFRSATLAEYTAGANSLALTTTEVPSTGSEALLTATIVRQSQRFDDACNDRFSTVSESDYALNSNGTSRLVLPWRTTRVYNLFTVDAAGVSTLQDSEAYRLSSSLDADGARRIAELDVIEIIDWGPGLVGTRSPWYFDKGQASVLIEADFGWTTTPLDVKRAVALLVYDHYKPISKNIYQADQWVAGDARYSRSDGRFGIPEVDDAVTEYRREGVGI